MRERPLRLLEIGAGGYADPHDGGHSLRMWKAYFPNAQITSIDIHDKRALQEERIAIYRGSQDDPDFLAEVNQAAGPFDIVIDDGSHISRHIICSFETLFPLLKKDGTYVVEDLETSYWKKFGGNSFNLQDKKTAMNYFKRLTDSLNWLDNENPFHTPAALDGSIVAMHFYHDIVFIQKGDNSEKNGRTYKTEKLKREKTKPFASKLKRYIKRRWCP